MGIRVKAEVGIRLRAGVVSRGGYKSKSRVGYKCRPSVIQVTITGGSAPPGATLINWL